MLIPASRNYTGAPLCVRVPHARPTDEVVPRPADFGIKSVTPELGERLITGLRKLPPDPADVALGPGHRLPRDAQAGGVCRAGPA